MVHAFSGDAVDGVVHLVGGDAVRDVEAYLAGLVVHVSDGVEGTGRDREDVGLCTADGDRVGIVGRDRGGPVSAGRVGCVGVHRRVSLTHGEVVLSGDYRDDGLSVLDLGLELGHGGLVGCDDERSVGYGVAVDVVHRDRDGPGGGGDLESCVVSGVDGDGSGSHGVPCLAVQGVVVGSGQDGVDRDRAVGRADLVVRRISLELEEHLLCAVHVVSDHDGPVDGCGGDVVGLDQVVGCEALDDHVADADLDPVVSGGDHGLVGAVPGGRLGVEDVLSVDVAVLVDGDCGSGDAGSLVGDAALIDLGVVGGSDVVEHYDGGQVVDGSSLLLLLLDGLPAVHVLPAVVGDDGVGIGVVLDLPVDDLVSGQSVSGDSLGGSLGAVAGGQGDQVVVGRVVACESGLGRGGSNHGLPQEGVVDGVGVDGVSVVCVVGVELRGGSVAVHGVVAEVCDGGERVPVAVLQGQHGGIEHDIGDLLAGGIADGIVGVHDLHGVHAGHDGVDGCQVHGVLVGYVGPDVAVRVGVGCDVVDGGGGVLDESPDLLVHVGVAVEAGCEVVHVVGQDDAEHHGCDRSACAFGEVHVRHGRGSATDCVDDGIESALGDRVVGVVDPGHEGSILGLVLHGVPEVPDGVGVACLDRVLGVAAEVVVGVGVVGDTGVHGERDVGDDDEKGHDDHGCEREGLDHLPEESGEPGGPHGCPPVPEVRGLEDTDDDDGGSDGEDCADDRGVGVGGPDREEHAEHPDRDEQPGGGVVLPEVDVSAVEGVADGQPHREPSVIGGHVGHGDVAACQLIHDRAGVDAVAPDEVVVQVGRRYGEDGRDDNEDDDECGHGDDPGLGADRHEDQREHDGDDHHEKGSGIDCLPESGGHVVCRGDQCADEQSRDVSEQDGLEVPSPEAVDHDLEDHGDDQDDHEEAEPVPCQRGEGHEDACDHGVDEDGLLGDILGIGGLDHLHDEPGHERDQERCETVLGSAGEDGGADGERQEGEDQGCDDSDPLVEHLLGDKVHGDACQGADDRVEGSDRRGRGLGGGHAHACQHGGDAGSDEVEEGREDVESSVGIVDGRIRHGVAAVQNTFNHVQVILRTRTARQSEVSVGGDTVCEHRAQRERHDHDDAERERTPVVP